MSFDPNSVDKWEEGSLYEPMKNLGPCLGGDWVTAEDYDALLALYRESITQIRELLKERDDLMYDVLKVAQLPTR